MTQKGQFFDLPLSQGVLTPLQRAAASAGSNAARVTIGWAAAHDSHASIMNALTRHWSVSVAGLRKLAPSIKHVRLWSGGDAARIALNIAFAGESLANLRQEAPMTVDEIQSAESRIAMPLPNIIRQLLGAAPGLSIGEKDAIVAGRTCFAHPLAPIRRWLSGINEPRYADAVKDTLDLYCVELIQTEGGDAIVLGKDGSLYRFNHETPLEPEKFAISVDKLIDGFFANPDCLNDDAWLGCTVMSRCESEPSLDSIDPRVRLEAAYPLLPPLARIALAMRCLDRGNPGRRFDPADFPESVNDTVNSTLIQCARVALTGQPLGKAGADSMLAALDGALLIIKKSNAPLRVSFKSEVYLKSVRDLVEACSADGIELDLAMRVLGGVGHFVFCPDELEWTVPAWHDARYLLQHCAGAPGGDSRPTVQMEFFDREPWPDEPDQ